MISDLNDFISKNKEWFSDIMETIREYARDLKKAEEWLSRTLKSIGDGVIATDREGRITFLNPVAESLTGWKEQNVIGKPVGEIFDIINEYSREPVNNPIYKVIEEGIAKGLTNHTLLISKGGIEIPIDDTAAPIKNRKGELIGVVLVFRDISKQKNLKRKLDIVYDAAKSSLSGMIITDMEDKIIYANPAFVKMFRYENEEALLGQELINLFDDKTDNICDLVSKIENTKTNSLEFVLHRVDNTDFPVDFRCSNIISKRGKKIGVVASFNDITEWKKAEKQLEKSRDQLKSLLNNLKDPILVISEDYEILFMNQNAISMFNGNYIGNECYKTIFRRETPCESCPKEILSAKNLCQYRTERELKPTPEEDTKYFDLNISQISDFKGRPAIVQAFRDITARKNAEEKLKKSKNQLNLMLNNLKDIIFVISGEYEIQFMNRHALSLFQKDLIGKKCYNAIFKLEKPCAQCPINKIIDGIICQKRMERTIKFEPAAKAREYDINMSPIKNFDGKDCIIEGLRDISKRKELEEDLVKSKKMVQEAFKKAEFYKDLLAHDVNNILQSVSTGLEINRMLIEQPNQLNQLETNRKVIQDQILKAAKLIRNVKKLSKLDDNNIALEPVNLCKILKNSIANIRKAHVETKLSIKTSMLEDVSNCWVKANELLEDVFDNILNNAIHHNNKEIVKIEIKLSREIHEGKSYIKIQFLDNGKGIEGGRKEKIFLRGYSDAKFTHGMGLGLSLVKNIIEIYKGEIWVEDRIEGDSSIGSNFIIKIPEGDETE